MKSPMEMTESQVVQRLADRSRITDLLLTFEEGMRLRDLETVVSVFSNDATLNYPSVNVTGMEDIRRYFASTMDASETSRRTVLTFDTEGFSTPFLGNVLLEFDEDTARCESTTLAIHAGIRDGGGIVIIRAVKDIDDLVRSKIGWSITRRHHQRLWSFEVPGSTYAQD